MIKLHSIEHRDIHMFVDSSYESMPYDDMHKMINDSIAKNHNGHFFELFAVTQDSVCVGFISLYEHNDIRISCGPEIKPKFRKQGFAYTAIKLALEYSKNIGFKKAVAQVRKSNTASIALHNKLGFTIHEEYTNDKGNPMLYFEKDL